MKRIVTFIFVFCFCFCRGQNVDTGSLSGIKNNGVPKKVLDKEYYRVVYQYKFKKDPKVDSYEQGYTLLQIGKKHVRFCDFNIYKADSIVDADSKKKINYSATFSKAMGYGMKMKYTSPLYFNVENMEYDVYYNISGIYHVYKDKVIIPWSLEKETKNIKGIDCKKATATWRGRNYTAWYAPEVKMPYGPYKFGGLPGLVFEVYDNDKNYCFSLYSLEPIDYDSEIYKKIEKRERVVEVSREKCLEIDKGYHKNSLPFMKLYFNDEVYGEEDIKRFSKEIPYNPIELE